MKVRHYAITPPGHTQPIVTIQTYASRQPLTPMLRVPVITRYEPRATSHCARYHAAEWLWCARAPGYTITCQEV